MKNRFRKTINMVLSLLMIGAVVIGIASCKSTAPTTPTAETSVLTVTKDSQNSTFTLAQLKNLPQITGWAGQMSSTGTISGPYQYKGVSLTELLKAVGGITENNAVRISAKDGYTMTISYNQITDGNFTVINSDTGKECTPSAQPVVSE